MDETKIFYMDVRVSVVLSVKAKMTSDGAEIVDVLSVDLPTARDVMEALDADDRLQDLDAEFESH